MDSSNKIEYDGVLVILMEKEKLSGQNIFVLDDKYFDFTRSLFTPRNLAHLRDEKKLRKLVYLYSDFQLKFFTSTFLKKSTEQYGLNVVSDRLGTRLNREGVHVFVFNVMEGPLCRMRNKIKETALRNLA